MVASIICFTRRVRSRFVLAQKSHVRARVSTVVALFLITKPSRNNDGKWWRIIWLWSDNKLDNWWYMLPVLVSLCCCIQSNKSGFWWQWLRETYFDSCGDVSKQTIIKTAGNERITTKAKNEGRKDGNLDLYCGYQNENPSPNGVAGRPLLVVLPSIRFNHDKTFKPRPKLLRCDAVLRKKCLGRNFYQNNQFEYWIQNQMIFCLLTRHSPASETLVSCRAFHQWKSRQATSLSDDSTSTSTTVNEALNFSWCYYRPPMKGAQSIRTANQHKTTTRRAITTQAYYDRQQANLWTLAARLEYAAAWTKQN